MRAVASLLFLLFLVLSCSEDPVAEREPPGAVHRPDAISLNREAEEAALWLSEELIAPVDLYETIAADLEAIRAEYGHVIPLDWETGEPIVFRPWWQVSYIVVYVTTELKNKVLANEPNVITDLNTAWHASGMSPFAFRELAPYGWRVEISFAGRQNSERLAELYDAADGVTLAFSQDQLGDASNVYPWHISGGMSYLFRNAFSDCPALCVENRFYYFRRVGDSTEYLGTFWLGIDPYPEWWGDASDAFCRFIVEQRHLPYCGWSTTPEAQSRQATPIASSAP